MATTNSVQQIIQPHRSGAGAAAAAALYSQSVKVTLKSQHRYSTAVNYGGGMGSNCRTFQS